MPPKTQTFCGIGSKGIPKDMRNPRVGEIPDRLSSIGKTPEQETGAVPQKGADGRKGKPPAKEVAGKQLDEKQIRRKRKWLDNRNLEKLARQVKKVRISRKRRRRKSEKSPEEVERLANFNWMEDIFNRTGVSEMLNEWKHSVMCFDEMLFDFDSVYEMM